MKSNENQKRSNRKLLPTSFQKHYERRSGRVKILNSQAPISNDEQLETNYDANLGNHNLPISQYRSQLLKRTARLTKKVPTQTLFRNRNQLLGPV